MATYEKFEQFVEDIAHGVHDLATDVATIFLTTEGNNPALSVEILSGVTEISYTNLSTRVLSVATSVQASGTFTQLWTDLTLTASGAVATFRRVGIYNETPTSPADPLIAKYDFGSDLTLADGETLLIDWTTSSFTLV